MQDMILKQAESSLVMQILLAMLPLLALLVLVAFVRFWRAGFWSRQLSEGDGGPLMVALRKI
ncbi:MAG TPA: hypothetical protein DHV49_02070, partial [Alphaproteobacteria bacterium]|nr:hypothetical protein [Alphaproteobacteria bacterium]